jgi:putative spermidine/putrescine transport system ATP-binding protein
MDEPLGALDKQLREQMQLEIRRLHRELGVTMVYVTHDQSEALTMSDRIAVFHQGTIQQIGPPEAIYDRPANAFVARFIGENNRVAGTVEKVEGSRCALRVNGLTLAGTLGGALAPGEPALLSVRPEQIVIGDAPNDCSLAGTLAEAIYLGDHLRLRIAVAGMGDIVVKSHAGQAPVIGSTMRLGWRAEDCRVFRLERE